MIFKTEQQEIPQLKPLLKKTRKKKEPLSGKERRVLVGIFLATVFLSLFFSFKAELPKIKRKITSPLIISSLPKEKRFDPTSVLGEIQTLTDNLAGTYGVYVYRLADKREYGVNQEKIFPAASLMKLPVMLLTYQEAEVGKLNLADYRGLLEVMGQRSDNAAYNRLVKYFGQEKIQQLITSLGMEGTFLAKDDTTPEDIGLFFRKLYQENLVNQVNREEILSFLTETIFEERIPAGVPENVRVSHKIGTEIGSYSDAGIIFAPKPFVLVIMSKNANELEAKEVLPKITKTVWEWEQKSSGF